MGIADRVIRDEIFFAVWRFNFESQLKALHEHMTVVDEGQEHHDFKDMPYVDFCLSIYTVRPELIDYTQN